MKDGKKSAKTSVSRLAPGGGGGGFWLGGRVTDSSHKYGKVEKKTDDKLLRQGLVGKIRPVLGPLRRRFGCPPFSILNAREGAWQQRKRAWIGLGIKSEVGRTEEVVYARDGESLMEYTKGDRKHGKVFSCNDGQREKYPYLPDIKTGTSIFDPVLSELAYNWWCPPGGIVVDPFAGGSVRGIVASVLGLKYWGCELRSEQVKANKDQLVDVTRGEYRPKWVCGDSVEELYKSPHADFLFSCPPYGNLEKYSEDPRDLSNMSYGDFLQRYGVIVNTACGRLRNHRFACFVVANYRDYDTRMMRNFVGDTIVAFEKAGLEFYTEAVLITAVGSAAMRAEGTFVRGKRKLVKTHQNVLVFVKGSPERVVSVIEGRE